MRFTRVEVKSCGDDCCLPNGLGKKKLVRLPRRLAVSPIMPFSSARRTEAIEATTEEFLEDVEVTAGADVFLAYDLREAEKGMASVFVATISNASPREGKSCFRSCA